MLCSVTMASAARQRRTDLALGHLQRVRVLRAKCTAAARQLRCLVELMQQLPARTLAEFAGYPAARAACAKLVPFWSSRESRMSGSRCPEMPRLHHWHQHVIGTTPSAGGLYLAIFTPLGSPTPLGASTWLNYHTRQCSAVRRGSLAS